MQIVRLVIPQLVGEVVSSEYGPSNILFQIAKYETGFLVLTYQTFVKLSRKTHGQSFSLIIGDGILHLYFSVQDGVSTLRIKGSSNVFGIQSLVAKLMARISKPKTASGQQGWATSHQ